MGLAETVNHALFKARLVEQLIHDPGPWLVEVFGHVFPAMVEVKEDTVVVHVTLDLDQCSVKPGIINLYCDERLAASRRIWPSDYYVNGNMARLSWAFGLGVQVTQ